MTYKDVNNSVNKHSLNNFCTYFYIYIDKARVIMRYFITKFYNMGIAGNIYYYYIVMGKLHDKLNYI